MGFKVPIVSSKILKSRDRGNGRLVVFEQHTDHNGEIHEHRYSCPVGHDINQELLNWVPKLNLTLVSTEKARVHRQIEEGVDPATIITKHLSATQKTKQVIRALMLGESGRMLSAAQLVKSFTDAQIDKHFTKSQRIRIRTRQNYIINNQTVITGDLREKI